MMRGIRAVFLGAALALASMPGMAASPSAPTIEDFLRTARFTSVKLSPKGTYVAATVPIEDKTVLVVLKPGQPKPVSHFNMRGKTHVTRFYWANDERLVFQLGERNGPLERPVDLGEIWGMDADGGKTRVLAGWRDVDSTSGRAGDKAKAEPVFAQVIDPLAHDDDKVLVSIWRSGSLFTSVERMDIDSGARTPVAQAPIERAEFLADREGVVRFAWGAKAEGEEKLFYRPSADQPWQLINSEQESGITKLPLAFDRDNRTVYLLSQHKTGPNSVVALDLATLKEREVARHDFVDPDGLEYAIGKDYPIGVRFMDPTPRVVYFDPQSEEAKLHRAVTASFDEDWVSADSVTTPGADTLLLAYGDRSPGDLYAFNLTAKRANHMMAMREWIDRSALATTQTIEFTARDGRRIQGFLTLPAATSKNLPMIVNPHGGPFGVADGRGYEFERQLLATHGYAVLQVNFRGSGGYGREFQQLGMRQWGATMQDDLTDATRWAIAQGIADPQRICIYGASYGGYASLMGAAKEPTLYRCAVGYVGVYDIPWLVQQESLKSAALEKWVKRWVGEPEAVGSISPTRLAGNINVPVFLAAGGEDTVAPIEHTKRMEKALRAAGKSVETLYYPTEGHGFYRFEHQVEFYTKLLDFFARNIGGQPPRRATTTGSR